MKISNARKDTMKYLKIACLLTLLASTTIARPQESGTSQFIKGAALSSLVDWVMEKLYGAPDKTIDYKFKKDSLTVFMRAAIDPFFEYELVYKALPATDPRKYILLALFQSGRLAPKAYDFVSQIATRLSNWWTNTAEPEHIKLFKEDNLNEWLTAGQEQCPTQPSLWEKITNHLQAIKDTALSCLVNFVISQTIYKLTSKAAGSSHSGLLDLGIKVIAQEIGVAGSTYLLDWAKNMLNDLQVIERDPQFKGTPLSTLGQSVEKKLETS